jgi:hypothetical protein
MQFPLTDGAAARFGESFYGALIQGLPVDVALYEARKTIYMKNGVEWGAPILYTGSADGNIFQIE